MLIVRAALNGFCVKHIDGEVHARSNKAAAGISRQTRQAL